MRAHLPLADLADAVKRLDPLFEPLIDERAQQRMRDPVEGVVFLTAAGNNLSLSADNGDRVTVRVNLGAEVLEPGEFSLAALALRAAVRSLHRTGEPYLTLEAVEPPKWKDPGAPDRLRFTLSRDRDYTGNASDDPERAPSARSYSIQRARGPEPPRLLDASQVEDWRHVPQMDIGSALILASFGAKAPGAKARLQAVQVRIADGWLQAVATDGHSLVCARRKTEAEGEAEFLLPPFVSDQFERLVGLGNGLLVGECATAGEIILKDEAGRVEIHSVSPDDYPRWQKVVPTEDRLKVFAEVDVRALEDVARSAFAVGNENANYRTRLVFSEHSLKVEAEGWRGGCRDRIPAKCWGLVAGSPPGPDSFRVELSAKKLLRLLDGRPLSEGRIRLAFVDIGDPAFLETDSVITLTMPDEPDVWGWRGLLMPLNMTSRGDPGWWPWAGSDHA